MKKGYLIVIGFVLLCILSFALLLWDYARIKSWGVGVESLEWLPEQASNITFISGNINRVAEFDIDLDSLAKWCTSIGKPMTAVAEGQYATIWRVNPFLDRFEIIKNGPLKGSSPPEEDFSQYAKQFTIGDLFYEDRWSNGGGFVIGYDVSDGRGYYQYSHH